MMQDTSLNIERTRDESMYMYRRIVVTARVRLVEGTKSTSEDSEFVWINRSNDSIPRSVLCRTETTRQFLRLFSISKSACMQTRRTSEPNRTRDFDNCLQEHWRNASKCCGKRNTYFSTPDAARQRRTPATYLLSQNRRY